MVEGGAGLADSADFNQNSRRDRTIASAYSLRPLAGAPVSTPMTWEERPGDRPEVYNLFTVPERLADGDPWAGIDDIAHSIEPLLRLYEESGEGEGELPARLPKMRGEPPRVQPSKKVASHWDENGERVED